MLGPAAAADDEQGPLRPRQQLERARDIGGRGRRLHGPVRLCVGYVRLVGLHVLGKRDHDRTRPPGGGGVEGVQEQLRQRGGVVGDRHPLGHLPEHQRVVELLERLPAEMGPRHVPDEQDQRCRVLVGGVDADCRVGGAGRPGDEAEAGPAGELAVGVGHVRRGRLVPGDDEPDWRVADRVEDAQIALARHAEGGVDPVDEQLIDEDARGGAFHRMGHSPKTLARWSLGRSSSAGST